MCEMIGIVNKSMNIGLLETLCPSYVQFSQLRELADFINYLWCQYILFTIAKYAKLSDTRSFSPLTYNRIYLFLAITYNF